jgi:hypothetical protein
LISRIFIDGTTIPISWALTNALPSKTLIPARPTARLLGIETIMSVIGPLSINLIITLLTVIILLSQPFYACNIFNGDYVDLRKWWELADNYVGSITAIITMYQMIHAALAYNIGGKYREGGLRNWPFGVMYGIFFLLITLILFLDPNSLGCTFRINCGTASSLAALGYSVPFNAPDSFFSNTGHNVIPPYFRLVIFGLSIVNLVLIFLWERVVILGIGRQCIIKQYGDQRYFRL